MLNNNLFRICGIDEVGRGSLAGPLVAAGVLITSDTEKRLLQTKLPFKDSKLLTHTLRNKIYQKLKSLHVEILVEVISSRKINNRGIARANRMAIKNIIRKIEADQYIVDGKLKLGRINGKTNKIKCIVDADATHLPTILAGIVAKVERDKIMDELHNLFPLYNWKQNAGYGTKQHIKAIRMHGISRYHRSIFVTTALKKQESLPFNKGEVKEGF